MDNNTKVVACFAIILASLFFLSITSIEQSQRNLKLQQLSNDAWVNSTIAKAFPGFPVISYLGDLSKTSEELAGGISGRPDMAKVVEGISGQRPEYFRFFTVRQREYDPLDTANHYHIGFITSDLDIYDVGLDVGLQ